MSLIILGDIDDLKQDVSSFRFDILNKLKEENEVSRKSFGNLSAQLDILTALSESDDIHNTKDKLKRTTDNSVRLRDFKREKDGHYTTNKNTKWKRLQRTVSLDQNGEVRSVILHVKENIWLSPGNDNNILCS